MPTKQLLIIGAGPYGLATAAYAKHLGIDYTIIGKPMEFWRERMPKGMLLRSGYTWHIDPLEINTLGRYLESKGIDPGRLCSLPVNMFVEYGDWFAESAGIKAIPSYVRNLEYCNGYFEAFMENGQTLTAQHVVVAPGLGAFQFIPADLASKLPKGRYTHTCAMVNFEPLAGQRCLVIGGRQSAFEWTALMVEAGVAQVHVAFPHEAPQFAPSDWNWVDPFVEQTLKVRGWFRHLPKADRETIERRFWEQDRLKLEHWLAPRISKENVKLWPHSSIESCKVLADGSLHVRLSGGARVEVDHIILATGHRVDVQQISFFSKTTILPRLSTSSGFPSLDEDFQTTLPGLYMTGLVATRDFGPLFGYVRGCPSSARIVGDHIQSHLLPGLENLRA